MKAVILAGGRGTRIAEESTVRPKPMITIGGRPMLWHIMQIYSQYGISDFIVCLGYKGYVIKEYFANFFLHSADVVQINLASGQITHQTGKGAPWRVTLVETGDATQTGGRIKRIRPWVEEDECFALTYGDGLAAIDISGLIAFHNAHGKLATMAAVSPPSRFGAVQLVGGTVKSFVEKPVTQDQIVNGGFFVLSPKVIDYIADDNTVWEREPLQHLAADGQLQAFQHRGFWQPMDTMREREMLEELWSSGRPPWLPDGFV
jgi:glucose-1-phosphate cytidylyltransferase